MDRSRPPAARVRVHIMIICLRLRTSSHCRAVGIASLVCLIALALLFSPLVLRAETPAKPNVVIILADDMGYGDVGFNGCKDIATPNIDSLARHGVQFANGYVTQPLCSPSRAGLLTGRYEERFGHENNPTYLPDDPNVGLPVDQVTIAQVMKSAGYATGLVGKWHLGAAPCFYPNARGFSEYFGFLGGGHVYLPYTKGDALYQQYVARARQNSLFGEYLRPVMRNDQPAGFNDYLTDVFSDEAEKFINRHKSEPFFLYLAYNAVHSPLEAPEKYVSRFPNIADKRRRTYAGMTAAMDDGIGQVLKTLRDDGLENNTIIWFFSDNGGPVYTEMPTSNAPLHGFKHQVYEGGIHVPFVVQWRGHLAEGTVYNQPIISMDIFPTAAAAAGAKVPDNAHLDGVNLLPYLIGQNQAPPHDALYWRNRSGGYQWAIRQGDYKLLSIKNDLELYNLKDDLAETTNLAQRYPDIVARLEKMHDAWDAQMIPPLWPMPKKTKDVFLGSIPFMDMEAEE
jgi:arylsulfatase A-like enzyme